MSIDVNLISFSNPLISIIHNNGFNADAYPEITSEQNCKS